MRSLYFSLGFSLSACCVFFGVVAGLSFRFNLLPTLGELRLPFLDPFLLSLRTNNFVSLSVKLKSSGPVFFKKSARASRFSLSRFFAFASGSISRSREDRVLSGSMLVSLVVLMLLSG
ncbi:hypothetical protein BKA69DRAFT_1086344, partial [Paraphysoderma sedebokerense]